METTKLESRRELGIPDNVEDPAVDAIIAQLIREGFRQPSAIAHEVRKRIDPSYRP